MHIRIAFDPPLRVVSNATSFRIRDRKKRVYAPFGASSPSMRR